MTIDDLVPLTNGLTVTACGQTLVCDRTRVTPVRTDAPGGAAERRAEIELKFLMAGTDFAPRLRLVRERVLSATPDEVTTIIKRVVKRAIPCH
jgi:hypothetical protein